MHGRAQSLTETITLYKFQTANSACIAAGKALASELASTGADTLFLSGGSSVAPAILGVSSANTAGLAVAQVDERFGVRGHEFSNWELLLQAGLQPEHFRVAHEVLGFDSDTADDAAELYEPIVEDMVRQSRFSMAVLGIGTDGHIAGILPMPQAREHFNELFLEPDILVAGYKAADFARITLTASALRQIDHILVYAAGKAKLAQLHKLTKKHAAHDQPLQILKQARHVTIFYGEGGE